MLTSPQSKGNLLLSFINFTVYFNVISTFITEYLFQILCQSAREHLEPGVSFTNILLEPFSYKSDLHSFSLVTVWLCNFLAKNIGAKGTPKVLVKLTTGVNFITILLEHFSYKSDLCSFSQVTVWLCNFLAKEYWHKSCW